MPLVLSLILLLAASNPPAPGNGSIGYYRFPALHRDTIVFGAEGDLWQVSRQGGVASRLTSHPADEVFPVISPDGQTLAFAAAYEGPTEVYTMPLAGGAPVRRTFDGGGARVAGFARDGALVYATRQYSTLPDTQLFRIDLATGERRAVPLAQAADGDWSADGRTFFFTRLPFQGSHTKRYRGGTAQSLWKYVEGAAEAVALTGDYPGALAGVRAALPSGGLSASCDDPEDARARELIVALGLRPLEGESGYFVEIGRSALTVTQTGRSLAAQSRILYMLTRERPVNFVHWLASDDTHVLLEGGPVDYFIFDPDGRASKGTVVEDAIRRVITVPAGSGKALRLCPDARYALLVNVLSPEWTKDRMRLGNSPDCLDPYVGRAPWATPSFLRELIGPTLS